MPVVRYAPTPPPRSRFARLAALVAVAAQLVLAVAPLAEARDGTDARAHVEPYGTRLHVAHEEAACPTCAAQHMVGRVEAGAPAPTPAERAAGFVAAARGAPESAHHERSNPPRAPPVPS